MVSSTLHQCVKYQRDGIEHMIKGDLQPFSIQEIRIYEDATYFIPKGSSSYSKLDIKIEEKVVRQRSNQEKEKGKIANQEMIQSSSEDDYDIIVLRPPNTLPQRGGRTALRRATPVYIDLESDSDSELENQGVALSLDYKNPNSPPKFDLTLDQDSDPEEDISKVKSDKPELIMYEKLSRKIEALSLTPLSAGRIIRLEVKVAPNLNAEVRKVQKFFHGSSSARDEGDVTLEEADFNELMELPFGYFPVCVKNNFFKGSVPYQLD
ncbi:hypothetical protein MA16_Dca004550 [Dendrobium catenatum]|uniref:Uncharacterized protein n=1 Tax=Dendrobium catenatum TaxID=906689 RepID=A0A2I0VNE5_9ASPA|nr:hypothetical protein MA16_Dca004550 [Dendrobium catenatum]